VCTVVSRPRIPLRDSDLQEVCREAVLAVNRERVSAAPAVTCPPWSWGPTRQRQVGRGWRRPRADIDSEVTTTKGLAIASRLEPVEHRSRGPSAAPMPPSCVSVRPPSGDSTATASSIAAAARPCIVGFLKQRLS